MIELSERALSAHSEYCNALLEQAVRALAQVHAEERGANGGEETSLSRMLKSLLVSVECHGELWPLPVGLCGTEQERHTRALEAIELFFRWTWETERHIAESRERG